MPSGPLPRTPCGPVRSVPLSLADALGRRPHVLGLLAHARERRGQGFLGLAMPTPFGLGLCAAATVASVAISRGDQLMAVTARHTPGTGPTP